MEGTNRLGSKSILARLGKVEVITMILALFAEIIIFSLLSPHFFTASNLLTIVQYCALVGIVALPFSYWASPAVWICPSVPPWPSLP